MHSAVDFIRRAECHEQRQQMLIGRVILHGMRRKAAVGAQRFEIAGANPFSHPVAELCHPGWDGSAGWMLEQCTQIMRDGTTANDQHALFT